MTRPDNIPAESFESAGRRVESRRGRFLCRNQISEDSFAAQDYLVAALPAPRRPVLAESFKKLTCRTTGGHFAVFTMVNS